MGNKSQLTLTKKSKQKTIAIITCWYGPYPWYFPYFMHSCKFNPTIDFLIITDNHAQILNKSENVNIIHKTLEEIRATASEKMGFIVNIDYAYKLCDFKPTYGFLFPEVIAGYDFWGHGDIDIIYGNIRNFMTNEILNNYDVISSRHDYITGTYCLFRNNEKINTLFMQSKDYQLVFSDSFHYCFDECNFLFSELQNGASIFEFPDNIQSMTYVVQKASRENKLRAFFDFMIIEGNPGKITWQNGKVTYKEKYECMFYHLIKFKTSCKPERKINHVPDVFHFTPTRILFKK